MLRTRDAIRFGIHPRTLYKLRDSGELERVGPRLYRLVTAQALTSPDWYQSPFGFPAQSVCLISALAHHGLTTQVPHAIDVALQSHAQILKIECIPIHLVWYSERSYSAGVETLTIDGVEIKIYSP